MLLLLQVAAQNSTTLSAAATARAAASSAHSMEPTAPYGPAFVSSLATSGAASTASKPNITTAPATTAPGTQDRLRWWGDLARQAYEAIDGSLQGFEEDGPAEDTTPGSGMSAQEAEMVKVGGTVSSVVTYT